MRVQSGTQQAYVLALDVGIKKDNVNKYLHHVIVLNTDLACLLQS